MPGSTDQVRITGRRVSLRRVKQPEAPTFLSVELARLESWDGLERMSNLLAVSVYRSEVPPLDALLALPRLVALSVSESRVPDLTAIAQLTQLEKLQLGVTPEQLAALALKEFARLERLRHFHLLVSSRDNVVADLRFLERLPALESLSVTGICTPRDLPPLRVRRGVRPREGANAPEVDEHYWRAAIPRATGAVQPERAPAEPDIRRLDGTDERYAVELDVGDIFSTDVELGLRALRRHLRRTAPELLAMLELHDEGDYVEAIAPTRAALEQLCQGLPDPIGPP